jgi:hypothetical protein
MTDDLRVLFDEYVPITNKRGRTDRFVYAKVRRGDKWFFVKRGLGPNTYINIQREQQWSEFMCHVALRYPDARIRGPVFRERLDPVTALFDYVDAPHLSDHHDLAAWQRILSRYAAVLDTIDRAGQDWTPTTAVDGPRRSQGIQATWKAWLGDNIARVRLLPAATNIIDAYNPVASTRMQHGDLTPWQMFDDAGTWIVFDGEKSGTDLYRYNDLAYGYGRLFTMLRSRQTAAQLLGHFLDISGVDHQQFWAQFLPVMTSRAIGMLSDAYNDEPTDDYVADAERLLDLCVNGGLNDLLAP